MAENTQTSSARALARLCISSLAAALLATACGATPGEGVDDADVSEAADAANGDVTVDTDGEDAADAMDDEDTELDAMDDAAPDAELDALDDVEPDAGPDAELDALDVTPDAEPDVDDVTPDTEPDVEDVAPDTEPDVDVVEPDTTDDADTSDVSDVDADVPDADTSDVTDADVVEDVADVDADVPDADVADADTSDVPDADVVEDVTDADVVEDVADVDADVPDADVADADTSDVTDADGADAVDATTDASTDATDATDTDVIEIPPECTPIIPPVVASAPIDWSWVDVTADAGISGVRWLADEPFDESPCGETSILTGGAAIADFDADGDMDIFVPRLGLPDRLYRNDGLGNFEDIAPALGIASAGSSNSASWVDVDADGDLDLFVGTLAADPNLFWIQQPGTWIDAAEATGLAMADPTVDRPRECGAMFSAAFADADGDADLDFFVSRWVPGSFAYASRYYENDGTGKFTDRTLELGLNPTHRSVVFVSSWFDFDEDDDLDVLVTADFETSEFFENVDNRWVKSTEEAGFGIDENGMGTTVGDVDRDGDLDVFVTAIYGVTPQECGLSWGCIGNRMYINNGDLTFTDCTEQYDVADGGWGWGTNMFDADLDGDLDVAMTGGYYLHWPEPSAFDRLRAALSRYQHGGLRLWVNEGETPFVEQSEALGFVSETLGRGLYPFDMDGDGDLDVFLVNNIAEPVLFENRGAEARHWLAVRLEDDAPNTHGIGASVFVRPPAGIWQRAEIALSASLMGSLPIQAHFGLGDYDGAVEVRVEWPDNTETLHTILETDRVVTLDR